MSDTPPRDHARGPEGLRHTDWGVDGDGGWVIHTHVRSNTSTVDVTLGPTDVPGGDGLTPGHIPTSVVDEDGDTTPDVHSSGTCVILTEEHRQSGTRPSSEVGTASFPHTQSRTFNLRPQNWHRDGQWSTRRNPFSTLTGPGSVSWGLDKPPPVLSTHVYCPVTRQ